MAFNISLICVNLPIYNDNTTFCGIANIWMPSVSKTASLIACLVPTFFAWIFTTIITLKIHKPLYRAYRNKLSPQNICEDHSLNGNIMRRLRKDASSNKASIIKETTSAEISANANDTVKNAVQNDPSDNKSQHSETFETKTETKYFLKENKKSKTSNHGGVLDSYMKFWASISVPQVIRKPFFMFSIVILTIIKLFWDATDVTIDAYLFYQLEMGEVIDISIYRNTTVNYFILAFSVLGCIKILFWLRIIGVGRSVGLKDVLDRKFIKVDGKKYLETVKLLFVAVTFMFEDGPELLLEYFYVEKYMSKQTTWYLLVRDVTLSIIALYSIIISSIWLVSYGLQAYHRKSFSKFDCSNLCGAVVHGGCSLLIGLCHFLRAGGAGYQYVTGKLRRSCFEVFDGVLRQTPFTAGCMREVDYLIVVLCGLALLLSVCSFVTVNHLLHAAYNSRISDRSTFWQKKYYMCC